MWNAVLGGAFIGTSVCFFSLFTGRVLGFSGIVHRLLYAPLSRADRGWHLAMVVGLVSGGLFAAPYMLALSPAVLFTPPSVFAMVMGGALTAVGTQMGSGCTSGHGVCGMSRLSPRSFVATLLFISSAMLTTFLMGSYPVSIPGTPIALLSVDLTVPLILLVASFVPFGIILANRSKLVHHESKITTLISLLCGFLFGAGLGIAGMLQPHNLASFFALPAHLLDSTVIFDPSMMIVMTTAILPNAILYNLILKSWRKPVFSHSMHFPTNKTIDMKLVVGQILFGVGLGMSYYCVGPSIASLGSIVQGNEALVYFISGYFLGSKVYNLL